MRRHGQKLQTDGLAGVLDIGTSKVCCLITALGDDGQPVLIGLGHQRSLGIKSGMIVDADDAERTARTAIAQAERMAGVALEQIVVAIACGRISAQKFMARAHVEGSMVSERDLDRVLAGGEAFVARSGRMLVHLGRSNWQLDGAGGVRDPRGMAGRELAVGIAAVTADEAPVRNLLSVIERCHLEVERLVPSPVASALAVTTEAERAVGILVVDVGGGTTTLAAFQDGALLVVEALPVGGNHMTYDVARALVTTVAEAERIKALYGTLVKAASDASELISYPVQGEEEPTLYQTSKAHVRSVLEPRIEGIFGLIEERLAATGCLASAKGRVVLTGGGAQLLGLDQAWMQRFGGDVRIGRPRPLGRMPASMCSPAFSTVIGLAYARTAVEPGIAAAQRSIDRRGGYLGRMQRWIGEGF